MDIPVILINGEENKEALRQPATLNVEVSKIQKSLAILTKDEKKQKLVLSPTKTRNLSISGALLTPPAPRIDKHLSFKMFVQLSFSGMAVLYGDLLISPVFIMNQVVEECKHLNNFEESILSCGSIIVWILLISTIKYCLFVFRIRNMGEGGILSVCESLPRREHTVSGIGLKDVTHRYLVWIALIASAWSMTDLFFLPSISSFAVFDGLSPTHSDNTIPKFLSILAIILIYITQKWGTHKLGTFFSILTILWTISLLALGIYNFDVMIFFKVINPLTMFNLLLNEGPSAFIRLWGICFLSISGLNIIYSEIGTFKRQPISYTILLFILPSLLINFIGQLSVILNSKFENRIFFNMVNPDLIIYLVVFSAVVVLAAANATITSIFSLCDKAISFGALPSLITKHDIIGGHSRIYIPQIVQIVVLYSIIAIYLSPYAEYYLNHIGPGISLEILFTWIFVLTNKCFKRKKGMMSYVAFSLIFVLMDVMCVVSQFYKILTGNVISLFAGMFIILIFVSWYSTQHFIKFKIEENEWTITKLRNYCKTAHRFDTLGVYFSYADEEIPFILKSMVTISNSVPNKIVMVTIMPVHTPFVNEEDRIVMRTVDPALGLFKCTICYGFCERNIPAEDAIRMVQKKAKIESRNVIYYASNFNFLNSEYVTNSLKERVMLFIHKIRTAIFEYCYTFAGNPVLQYDIPKQQLFVIHVPYSI